MSIDKSTVLSMSLEDILKAVKDPSSSRSASDGYGTECCFGLTT